MLGVLSRHRFLPQVTGSGFRAGDWVASTGLFAIYDHLTVDANNQVFLMPILMTYSVLLCKIYCCSSIVIQLMFCYISELGHEKICFMPHANNKGADQPAHPCSLISAFVVRCKDRMIPLVYISEISRFTAENLRHIT